MQEVRPPQLSNQRLDNPQVRKDLREPDHAEEVAPAEPSTELRRQLSSQCLDNLVAVLRPLLAEDVTPDTPADLPVEAHQAGIDGPGDALAGGQNRPPDVGQQRARAGPAND